MDSLKIGTHRDCNLFYNEDRDVWWADTGSQEIKRNSLAELKTAIDKALKSTSKYKDMKALAYEYHGNFSSVTITSVNEDGEVWIRHENTRPTGRRREKLYDHKNLYVDNGENREKVEKIKGLQEKETALREKRNEIVGSMERLEIIPGE